MWLIRLISLTALLSVALAAQTAATIAPADDSATGGFSTTPLWSKINEDIDSPDGTVITSGNNPSAIVTFTVTCPADLETITEANLRLRARQNNVSRNISAAVSWSATSATNFNTSTLNKTALQNYASGNQTGLSISKATCDSSTLSFTPTTTGTGAAAQMTVDTFNLDITYTAKARKAKPVVMVGTIALRGRR
jgi:hypothetical protein